VSASKRINIVKAYLNGVTMSDIAELFKVSFHEVVNTVHAYKVKGVRWA
jgi:transposase